LENQGRCGCFLAKYQSHDIIYSGFCAIRRSRATPFLYCLDHESKEIEKMSKSRFSYLFIILLLAFVLTACGGSSATEEPAAEPAAADTGAQPAAEPATAEPATAEPAAAEPAATEPAADTGLPDLGGREVTIAVENAYLPFNYISLTTGEPAGWDYEALNAMCDLLNCVPTYVEAAWEGMIQAVADGQYDMAADGITITPDRAEIVDFSDGYISIEQRLLVRIDEDRFETPDDIIANPDIVIGTQTGTTNYETAVALFGADRIQAFEQFPFAVQALISGDVDVVIMDETAGQGYVGVNADSLKLIGPSLSSDQLGFIFPKGSDLVEPINMALTELAANGTLDELANAYFSDQFTVTYDDIGPGAYGDQ